MTHDDGPDPLRADERERRRLAALVAADGPLLDELHADDFVLVNPGGGVWDRAFYLGGVADGSIDYRRFEAVTPIEVLGDARGWRCVWSQATRTDD